MVPPADSRSSVPVGLALWVAQVLSKDPKRWYRLYFALVYILKFVPWELGL